MIRERRRWRKGVAAAIALFVFWLALGYIASYFFVRPAQRPVAERDTIGEHPIEAITLRTVDGLNISGWYAPRGGERAVILMSGIWSTRTDMVSRAEWYLARGYSTVLLDLRGTGMSDGSMVSFGWHERHDLAAARDFLRDRGYPHAAAHGISLGAATTAFSAAEIPDYAFVVLESSYDTLENAYRNRLAMVGVPHFITYPVRWFVQLRLRERAFRLNPMDAIRACTAPTLILAGDAENEIKIEETEAIFEASGAALKRLHFFSGARHENFHRRYREEFERVLGDFLDAVEAEQGAAAPSAA